MRPESDVIEGPFSPVETGKPAGSVAIRSCCRPTVAP